MVGQNTAFLHSLKKAFGDNGYEVTLATAEAASATVSPGHPPSMILVDRLAANPAALRRQVPFNAVPMLSFSQPGLNSGEEECVADLENGSDISVCNESVRQLLARTRAVLRRARYTDSRRHYEAGDVRIDLERYEVRVRGRLVDLTPKEFKILLQLVRFPGHVFSRQELMNSVWGEDYALEEHAVDVHIHSLRQKIEPDPSRPIYVVTVRRVGFKFPA
jgi:DNA-binding response OmpR family regulator